MLADYLEKAVKKLRGHSYSQAEIRQYLQDLGAEPLLAQEVVNRLVELSYLNDTLLAQNIYRSCRKGKPCGQVLWSEKLRNRGIPEEIIQQLISEVSREEEYDLAEQLATEYLRNKAQKSYLQQYRGLAAYLTRRGFALDIVEQITREKCDNCQPYT